MASRSESLAQDLKAWAANQLQVEPECAPAQVRAAFYRQMRFDNGEVNLASREALLILTGRGHAGRPALALAAAEENLQRDVDNFGTRFFALSVTERKAEWASLRARGQGFPRVDARLAALRVGIDVTLPVLERDTPAQELATLAAELFVLRPMLRAARRRAFLGEAKYSARFNLWIRTASLLRTNESIAPLDPELFAALSEGIERADDKRQLNRTMRKAVDPVPAGKSSFSWIWLVAVVGMVLARFLAVDRTPPRPEPNFVPVPNFNERPKFDQNDLLKNLKFKKTKDGQGWELDPAEVPKDKRDLP